MHFLALRHLWHIPRKVNRKLILKRRRILLNPVRIPPGLSRKQNILHLLPSATGLPPKHRRRGQMKPASFVQEKGIQIPSASRNFKHWMKLWRSIIFQWPNPLHLVKGLHMARYLAQDNLIISLIPVSCGHLHTIVAFNRLECAILLNLMFEDQALCS